MSKEKVEKTKVEKIKKEKAKKVKADKSSNNKKQKSSVRIWIFTPITIMIIMMVASSVLSITNLQKVNNKATDISDVYLESISQLGDIQGNVKDLHTMSLSHIVATDANTMITLIESIREAEATIEAQLANYKQYVDDEATYEAILSDFEQTKKAIATMVALSADTQNEKAFAVANNELKSSTDSMNANISKLIEAAKASSESAKNSLEDTYHTSIIISIAVGAICVFLSLLAVVIVQSRVLGPIVKASKKLDEIGVLTSGINTFIETLQKILKTVSESSIDMNAIACEVTDSMIKSNESVADLSAVTEELSATMTEVANNTFMINDSATAVSNEVKDIVERTNEINAYTKKMKDHADQLEHTAKKNMQLTSEKVTDILTVAVGNLAEQATELVNYVKESIMKDLNSFVVAGGEYRDNATFIEGVMDEFTKKTDVLNSSVDEIAKSIDSISLAINEGVEGVSGTAENMQTLAMEIDEVSKRMEKNQEISGGLKEETEIFVNL